MTDTAGRVITVEELLQSTETTVRLPLLSRDLGAAVHVRVTRIAYADYLAFLPPPPPGAHEWPEKEFVARELAWLETLPPEKFEARRALVLEVKYRVIVAAALEPRFTVDQARRLGEDAWTLAQAILQFSGILQAPGAAQDATASEAAPVSGTGEPASAA
jgi:hypothetical protein